jgi:predicted nuclease of predicted toxin-antitoxin system
MRVLFDQGVPVPLRRALSSHTVSTAYEKGWSELANGELLKQADAEFDVLVTTDQGLRFQQNLAGLRLAIIVLPTTDWVTIERHHDAIAAAIDDAQPGKLVALNWR